MFYPESFFIRFVSSLWFIVGVSGLVIFIGLTCLHFFVKGNRFKGPVRADKMIAIITGISPRAKEVIKDLAKRGATIYIGCQNTEYGDKVIEKIINQTKNKSIYCKLLDLNSFKSIREFADTFHYEQSKLDVLIHDESVVNCSKALTVDGVERHLGINYVGRFLLTNLLQDELKEAAPSRVIVVTNKLYFFGNINKDDLNSDYSYSFFKSYCQCQFANMLYAVELARRFEEHDITVNAVCPGLVKPVVKGCLGDKGAKLLNLVLTPFLWPFFKTPIAGAQTILYAALEPKLQSISGKLLMECSQKEVFQKAQDMELSQWLFDETEQLIREKESG